MAAEASGWSRCPLSEAVEVNPKRSLKRGLVAPYVPMDALDTSGPRLRYLQSRESGGGGARFQNGDTLFARITPCAENGKTGYVDCLRDGEIGTGSTEFIVLAPKAGTTDSLYVYYLAKSDLVRSIAISRMRGTSGRQRVPHQVFDEIMVGVPPLPEQRKIAAILSSVDDAIEKTQAVIDQVQVVKNGLMQQLLTRGIPGRHTKFKRTEIGKIPGEWGIAPLGELAEVERGKFSHRPRNDPRFFGGPYPFIQTGDIVSCDGQISTYSQTLNEEGLGVSKLFPAGTIVITIAANIGETGIATFDVAFPDSLVGIQPGPRLEPHFLELVLRTRKADLDASATESAQKNINLQTLRPLPIQIPSLEEQARILGIVESHRVRLREERLFQQRLQALKTGLMSALLTGELRVDPPTP